MFINLLKNHLNRFKLISFLSLPSIKNCLVKLRMISINRIYFILFKDCIKIFKVIYLRMLL